MGGLIKDVADTPQSGAVEVRPIVLSPETLISQAIDKDVPVETMEKLLVMRRELKDEQAREAFFRDLAQFQAECPVIKKNIAVKNKPSKGGGIRYHYAPLDEIVAQVQGLLQKFGFSYTIQTVNEKNPDGQRSICTVHHIEGHSRESEFWAPVDHEAYMSDQQKWAAASTYGKRYAFCNAFGILTGDEDNDAQEMKGNDKKPDPPQKNGVYRDLEKQILKDISDEHFGGPIEFDSKPVDLDEVGPQMKEWVSKGPHSLRIMTESAKNISRMLLIAIEEDSKDGAAFVDPKGAEQLSDDDVMAVMQGELVDTPETEGNLNG